MILKIGQNLGFEICWDEPWLKVELWCYEQSWFKGDAEIDFQGENTEIEYIKDCAYDVHHLGTKLGRF